MVGSRNCTMLPGGSRASLMSHRRNSRQSYVGAPKSTDGVLMPLGVSTFENTKSDLRRLLAQCLSLHQRTADNAAA